MTASSPRATTGIAGLDDVLNGGLIPSRLYLVEGTPGSGKTTLAFQFLMEGVRLGEPVLYIALSESAEEIRDVAASHGWSLDGVTIHELIAPSDPLEADEQYTVFHPSEIERAETVRSLVEQVDNLHPARVVVDSLSELRLLSGGALRYRRQILGLKRFFSGQRCTVLLLDDLTSSDDDPEIQSIVHGALLLEHTKPRYGLQRRMLSVTKYRGSDFRSGYHDYAIRRGGLEIFPRLIAAEYRRTSSRAQLDSGVPGLDTMLGGGIERGTSTLLLGAAGTGKSTLAAMFAARAAARGQRASMFLFDESQNTLLSRMAGLGVDLEQHRTSGEVAIQQVDPAELSPGEFGHRIRRAVLDDDVSVVVIDSLNGYLQSMPDEQFLIIHLHELLTFLGQHGIATILVSAHQGVIGPAMISPVDASYLADSIVLLRYFELQGEVRQAISTVKKRGGTHERTIREFRIGNGRIEVGDPLRDFRGIFTGVPEKKAAS
jgi:circadian clock protein KaiC